MKWPKKTVGCFSSEKKARLENDKNFQFPDEGYPEKKVGHKTVGRPSPRSKTRPETEHALQFLDDVVAK